MFTCRGQEKRLQEWPTPSSSPDQAALFLSPYPGPIWASRNDLQPWGAEGLPRESWLCPVTGTWHLPQPHPPQLLTARAVEQLHDPEAVVQQGFGPYQLQAQPWGTQE